MAGTAPPSGAPADADALGAWVEDRARALAGRAYSPPTAELPGELSTLDYDGYRSIRYRPEAAVWNDSGAFQLQLFHPGGLYDRPVEVNVVEDSVRELRFDPSLFSYEGPAEHVRTVVETAHRSRSDGGTTDGFAGFRVHAPLNAPDRLDEVAVFLGASYFRLVGEDQVYGLSLRGLAVNVAAAVPEEFPDFRAFWLVRPASDADSLAFHALLDSPSVTGAYRFVLRPGASTTLDVDARLFARTDVAKLGIAPASSMFLFDPGTSGRFDDFRAGVHDSDGLLAHTSKGEWIWRPLTNHRGLRVSSLRDVDPRGFGLAQRARRFSEYLDLEALYHRRPSAWVEVHPEDAWGPGGVELLEMPTQTEYADNVAAYWVPDGAFRAGEERRYRYRISTYGARLPAQPLGQVVRTRSSRVGAGGAAPGAAAAKDGAAGATTDVRRFVVDFAGGALDRLPPDAEVEVEVTTLAGTLHEVRAERLPDASGWRASFIVAVDGERPPDLRLFLVSGETTVTETWSYVWYPEDTR